MDLFGFINSDKKDKALRELEASQKAYEALGQVGNEAVVNLYMVRKAAMLEIEKMEDILKRQPDFDIRNIKKIADARASIRLFTEAVQKEVRSEQNKENSVGDYSEVIAMSTTFATAALTTALRVLPGLATRVGSAAGVVGTTIALGIGSTLLSMAGPIGLAIGGALVGSTMKKNQQIIEEATKMKSDLDRNTKKIKMTIGKINQLSNEISSSVAKLSVLSTLPPDMLRPQYNEIVDEIVNLCPKINRKFTV